MLILVYDVVSNFFVEQERGECIDFILLIMCLMLVSSSSVIPYELRVVSCGVFVFVIDAINCPINKYDTFPK